MLPPTCTLSLSPVGQLTTFDDPRITSGKTSQGPLKYFDYFEGAGKPVHWVHTIKQALEMIDDHSHPIPSPRFSVAELLELGSTFVRKFPFRYVCESATEVAAAAPRGKGLWN